MNTQFNHYKSGDKIYASEYFITDTTNKCVSVLRLIKNQNFPFDYKLARTPYDVCKDNLIKNHTSVIATYLGYDFEFLNVTKTGIAWLYIVKPNWKAVDIPRQASYNLPVGYELANENFYLLGAELYLFGNSPYIK